MGRQVFEHVIFEYASCDFQTLICFYIWSKFLLWKHSNLLITTAFWIKLCFVQGRKQGMFIKDECISRYNRVGDFLVSVWESWKEIFIQQWISRWGQSKQPHPRVWHHWHWVLWWLIVRDLLVYLIHALDLYRKVGSILNIMYT